MTFTNKEKPTILKISLTKPEEVKIYQEWLEYYRSHEKLEGKSIYKVLEELLVKTMNELVHPELIENNQEKKLAVFEPLTKDELNKINRSILELKKVEKNSLDQLIAVNLKQSLVLETLMKNNLISEESLAEINLTKIN